MRKSSLDALIPGLKQRLLRATYGEPERWWYLTELADQLETSPSSLQREVESLSAAGILLLRRDGRRTYYCANTSNPIFSELLSILEKTAASSKPRRRPAPVASPPCPPIAEPESPALPPLRPPTREVPATIRPIVINMAARRRRR